MDELNLFKQKNTYFWLMLFPLLLHIAYEFMFIYLEENILIFYNLISIFIFLLSMFYLFKRNQKLTILLCFNEVTVFCTIATIVMGWEYGFQNWLIPSCILCLSIPVVDKKGWFYLTSMIKGLVYTSLYFIVYLKFDLQKFTLINMLFGITNVFAIFGIIFFSERAFQWSSIKEKSLLEVEKMEKIVATDELTGLVTRHKMKLILDEISADIMKKNKEFFIAFADIDDFKYVNDNYGHDVGDKVLARVAEILKQELRNDDIIARWGGEEFLILLRNEKGFRTSLDKEQVFLILDRVRQKIESQKMEYKGEIISITMTFGGVSSLDIDNILDMVNLADEYMYEGKNSGKNMVIVK